VGGRPYGVDVLIPVVYDREAEASTEEVIDLIPAEQRQFVDKLLDAEGVPRCPPTTRPKRAAS
jgi:hypothetical protein